MMIILSPSKKNGITGVETKICTGFEVSNWISNCCLRRKAFLGRSEVVEV